MTIDDYLKLKAEEERLRTAAAKAAGVEAQLLKQLQTEFGCQSYQEGKKLEQELQQQEREALTKAERALAKYRKQVG